VRPYNADVPACQAFAIPAESPGGVMLGMHISSESPGFRLCINKQRLANLKTCMWMKHNSA